MKQEGLYINMSQCTGLLRIRTTERTNKKTNGKLETLVVATV